MRRNLDWQQGSPDHIEAGMVLLYADGTVTLIGSDHANSADAACYKVAQKWAYVIKPYEINWLENMINRSGKGRGEG